MLLIADLLTGESGKVSAKVGAKLPLVNDFCITMLDVLDKDLMKMIYFRSKINIDQGTTCKLVNLDILSIIKFCY